MSAAYYPIVNAYVMITKAELIAYLSNGTDPYTGPFLIVDGTEESTSPPRSPDIHVLGVGISKRSGLFPKNNKIHWYGGRQRNLRGRQHQRLISQRTTNK